MRADATAAALDCTQAIVSARDGIGAASTFSKSRLAFEAMAGDGFWPSATAPVSANRVTINVGQADCLPPIVNRPLAVLASQQRGRGRPSACPTCSVLDISGQQLAADRSRGDPLYHVR